MNLNEEEYLQYTINCIKELINHTESTNNIYSNNIEELKTYMEVHINNQIESKKLISSGDEIVKVHGQINSLFMNYELGLKNLKNFRISLKRPYFGNITLIDDNEKQKVYIGVKDVINLDNQSIVSDWRAPISSLYYTNELGKAKYETEKDEYEVELISKKQIGIKDGKIEYIYETDDKINDEILIHFLMQQKSSAKMKNIIQTIQSEQNEIIRQPSFFNIIINGIAGSGKTSIAMHRIAYLLYKDKKNITTDNIVIISPNQLFSDFIGNLLPELGEENVESFSFRTLVSEHFANLATTETKSEMLEDALSNNNERLTQIQEKYTSEYAEKLMDFLASIDVEKVVGKIYYNFHTIDLTKLEKKYSLTHENRYKIFRKIDFILDTIILKHFKKANEKRQEEIRYELKNQIVEKLLKKNLFAKFVKKYGIATTTIKNNIAHDDIPTYSFIMLSILGFRPKEKYKIAFIDEIQDYDALSLKIIKEIFPNARFVIVGDIKQNIVSTSDNADYLKTLLPNSKTYNLTTSYRSTTEIMTFANSIIDFHYLGNFIRHGNKPKLYTKCKYIEQIQKIVDENLGKQIAIICKTKKEAISLASKLPSWTLVDDEYVKQGTLDNDKIITTVYLSKGLEFDIVIIPNIENENFNHPLQKQLLYIMSTRALHNLYLLSEKELDSLCLVENISKNIEIM